MRILLAMPIVMSFACKVDDTPTWAFDPIYVEPQGDDLYGFQTWEFFGKAWQKKQRKKHYLCSVVVELLGTAMDPCDGCDLAWSIESALLETDCSPSLAENEAFTALQGLALGDVDSEIEVDNPYPGDSLGGYVSYEEEAWEPHGWAYPTAYDYGEAPTVEWDDEPFMFWPAFVWEVDQL